MTYSIPKKGLHNIHANCPCGASLSIPCEIYEPAYVEMLEAENQRLREALEDLERVSGQAIMADDLVRAKARALLGYK